MKVCVCVCCLQQCLNSDLSLKCCLQMRMKLSSWVVCAPHEAETVKLAECALGDDFRLK